MNSQEMKTAKSPVKATTPGTMFKRVPTHQEVKACAHQLWENYGRPEGRDAEIWYEAERKLGAHHEGRRESSASSDLASLLGNDGTISSSLDDRLEDFGSPAPDRSATSL